MRISEWHAEGSVQRALLSTGEARLHFSQLGEDAIIWHHFASRKNGFYVDVGCHHPFRYSNTALLHVVNGWTGINIDLDERAIAAFKAARPGDINLQMAVGAEEGEATATVFEDGAVNTLDKEAADYQAKQRKVVAVNRVRVRPLAAILREYLPPGRRIDFLDVDAEGWDQMILSSNDWTQFRPEMIAVEAHGFDLNNPSASETFRFMGSQGYRLVSHALITSLYLRVG